GKEVIRTLTSKKIEDKDPDQGSYASRTKPPPLPTEPGLHRVVWNLHHKGAFTISGARVDSGRPEIGPLVNPGKYVVRLGVNGQKVGEEDLNVLLEPRLKALKEDVSAELEAQLKFALDVRDAITRLAVVTEKLRSVKKQWQERDKLLKDDDRGKQLNKELAR